ncbi:CAP domain-containing protein [Rothia nasisuis]|uniref:CAP domain-containing protein n=1 Tax=Rothia nasisuis TaxID=2109647 RepID=UPI001F27BF61|nr:CAP domain-containing protein [Rothia nasisuis]
MKNLTRPTGTVKATRRQVTALALSSLALGTAATVATAASSDIRTVSAAQRAADQQTLLNLINTYRAQNGLGAVKHSATVASVMESEAIRQFKAGAFSHGTEFIYNSKVQGYSFVREIIALSYNDDLGQLMNFWKGSAPHRAAVLAPEANVIGIGLCYGHGASLPWRVLGNVGIYRYEAGKGPNDYVSTISSSVTVQAAGQVSTAYPLNGAIGNYFRATGGVSVYGQPTGSEFASVNGGVIQNFSNARSIYWTPAYGAHTVYWKGAIGARYARQNYEKGSWGYPMNSEYEFWGSVRQDFVKDGSITSVYWTPSTGGAYAVNESGSISARWYALGGPSKLGFPVTDETRWADGVVRVTFSGGTTINWSESRGVWVS